MILIDNSSRQKTRILCFSGGLCNDGENLKKCFPLFDTFSIAYEDQKENKEKITISYNPMPEKICIFMLNIEFICIF